MPESRQGNFAITVAKWAKEAKGAPDQVLRAVVIGLLNNLVFRSPVGDPDIWKFHPQGNPPGNRNPPPGYVGGRFRGNWQVTVGEPASGDLPDIDPTGAGTVVRAQATINGVRCGPPVYIVNNLPYAIELEYGHSSQAPGGMVRIVSNEFEVIVERSAREARMVNEMADRLGQTPTHRIP